MLSYTATAADGGKATYISVAEFGGASIYRTIWVSKNKCEMTGATKMASNTGPLVYFTVGGSPLGAPNVNMQAGETWYIMIRNWRFTKASNSCTGAGTPPCATSFTPYRWQ